MIKSREAGNNEDSVYFWAPKGQRLYIVILKWPLEPCARRDNGKFRWYFRANFGNITRISIIKMSTQHLKSTWLWTFDMADMSFALNRFDRMVAFNKSPMIYGWLRLKRQLGTCWGGPVPKISLCWPMLRGVSCFFWERLKSPSGWNLQVESLTKISRQQIMAFVVVGAKSQ